MTKFRTFIVYILLATVFSVCLTGCHTVEGMGKDIEKGGEAIQDAAD